MALIEVPAMEALVNRRAETAGWGDRLTENRVSPMARPGFQAGFRFEPGEQIFTIGSCFARNVERELAARGFRLPMLDLLSQPRFRTVNPAILNNYGVPSIHNEFSWALNPDTPFDPKAGFVEVSPGRFTDLHVLSADPPQRLEVLQHRREAMIAATRAVADCRVVIMTLGLVELWYDRLHGVYLNATPLPRVLKQAPERFVLRVLDFDETLRVLRATLDLLQAHCRADQQILLTVSPVPLITTFRPGTDVMVANAYSKACLRTVAEHVCAAYDHLHYFPSYESVTLSDREAAWKEDNVHVTEEIVRFNVTRMIDAYCPPESGPESGSENGPESGLEIGPDADPDRLPEEAARRAAGPREPGLAFFEQFAGHSADSPEFAAEAVTFYLRWQMPGPAQAHLAHFPTGWRPALRALRQAQIHMLQEEYDRVPPLLRPYAVPGQRQLVMRRLLVMAHARAGQTGEARIAALDWLRSSPDDRFEALVTLAGALQESAPAEAAEAYDKAAETGELSWRQVLARIECLIRSGARTEARAALAAFEPQDLPQSVARDRLETIL